MATRLLQAIKTEGTHEVGFMQTMAKHRTTIPYGAIPNTDIDNFLPVYLDGLDADGNQKCKAVDSATDGNMFLLTTPELRPLGNVLEESLKDFYNASGEPATVDHLKPYITTFQTSAFSLDSNNTVADTGDVAYFDNTTQKYVICDPTNLPVAYGNAGTQFQVRYGVDDIESLSGKETVSLMVTKN